MINCCASPTGLVVVATLACGGSAFSIPPSSSAATAAGVAGARLSSRHMMTAAAPGPGSSEYSAAELPTSRKDVLGAVFGAAAMSSFAFVSAADAKVCAERHHTAVCSLAVCVETWAYSRTAGPETRALRHRGILQTFAVLYSTCCYS